MGERRLLALVRGHRMKRLLARMLDPDEFLSDFGIRAISRYHLDQPYRVKFDGSVHEVRYEPAESSTGLFGGNSNWRGADLVSDKLSARRSTAEVPPLLRG